MPRFLGVWVGAVLTLILAFGSTNAQETDEVDASGTLRSRASCLHQIEWDEVAEDRPVRLLRHDGTTVSGHVRSRSYHRIVLETDVEGAERVTVADTEITGVAYWERGPRKSHVLKGVGIGIVAGFAIGFLIGNMVLEQPDPGYEAPQLNVIITSFYGMVGGAVLGGLVGHAASGEGAPTERKVTCAP